MKTLNLGCGEWLMKGAVNVDIVKRKGVIKSDLNKKFPFKSDSFDLINCSSILEHITDPLKFMMEVRRVAKSGAFVYVSLPHYTSRNAWGDLEHKRGYSSCAFVNQEREGLFRIVGRKIVFSKWKFFMNVFNINYKTMKLYEHCPLLPADDMIFWLRVVK